MIWWLIFLAVILVLVGIAYLRGKCDGFIAGYNTSSPEKQHIEEGFNPFRLLRLLGNDASLDDVTVSFRARVALRGGIGKNIEMEDIPLSTLLTNLSEQHEDEP